MSDTSESDTKNEEPQQEEPQVNIGALIQQAPTLAIKVIKDPVGFYREMPVAGGFIEPIIFLLVMGVATGIIRAVIALLGLNVAGAMAVGVASIILAPIFILIFSFIGAAIAFGIWALMGSKQSFETAYRCVAFTSAVSPVVAVISIIPYLGSIVNVLWPFALLAIASIHVHQLKEKLSWIVFGVIGVLLALNGIGMERAGRQMSSSMQGFNEKMQEGDMTPEEAGKALGEFLKGLEESQKEKQ